MLNDLINGDVVLMTQEIFRGDDHATRVAGDSQHPLNINIVSSFGYGTPPGGYGGTEAVVARQAIGYMERGHNVTVYAAEGSQLPKDIEVVTVCEPLLLSEHASNYGGMSLQALERAFAHMRGAQGRGKRIDIIDNHFHPEPRVHELARAMGVAAISTLHGRLDADPAVVKALAEMRAPLVSISNAQRMDAPDLNYVDDPVWHGVEVPAYEVNENPENYAITIARVHEYKGHKRTDGTPYDEKGIMEALMLTRELEIPYLLVAKVDRKNQEHVDFFETFILPLINAHPNCEYIPEVTPAKRDELLRSARVHLSLVRYREAFGLAPVEAAVAGVPTLGTRRGALVETITDGINGYLCESWADAVESDLMGKIDGIDRQQCRDFTAQKFTIENMVDQKLARIRSVLAIAA